MTSEYGDGVIVTCDCISMEAIPAELGEPELPSRREIVHDAQVFETEKVEW